MTDWGEPRARARADGNGGGGVTAGLPLPLATPRSDSRLLFLSATDAGPAGGADTQQDCSSTDGAAPSEACSQGACGLAGQHSEGGELIAHASNGSTTPNRASHAAETMKRRFIAIFRPAGTLPRSGNPLEAPVDGFRDPVGGRARASRPPRGSLGPSSRYRPTRSARRHATRARCRARHRGEVRRGARAFHCRPRSASRSARSRR